MACPKGKKLIWRYLEKLQSLLQRLDQQRRSKLLRGLNEAQRLDLERWMLEYKSGQPKDVKPAPVASGTKQVTQGFARSASAVSTKTSAAKAKGVLSRRRYGSWRYFAVVVVHRLQLRSKEVNSLQLAAMHHQVLLQIKEEIAADLAAAIGLPPDEALAFQLTNKVSCILQKFQLNEDDLGLQVRAVSPIMGTVLCGPVFHLRNFQLGIAGWQFLQLARGVERPSTAEELQEAWVRSRQAMLQLWAVAGRSPSATARRLDDLEKRQSFEELQRRRALQQRRRLEAQDLRRRSQVARQQRQQERLEERIHQLLMKFQSFGRRSRSRW